MVIDLRKIRQFGKDEEEFSFEYLPENQIISIPNVVFSQPVKVSGKIMLSSKDSALVQAQVTFALKGECTRCLNETEKTFTVDFNELFEKNGEDGVYEIVNDKVDLTKPVNDLLILEMPLNFLCREDCKVEIK